MSLWNQIQNRIWPDVDFSSALPARDRVRIVDRSGHHTDVVGIGAPTPSTSPTDSIQVTPSSQTAMAAKYGPTAGHGFCWPTRRESLIANDRHAAASLEALYAARLGKQTSSGGRDIVLREWAIASGRHHALNPSIGESGNESNADWIDRRQKARIEARERFGNCTDAYFADDALWRQMPSSRMSKLDTPPFNYFAASKLGRGEMLKYERFSAGALYEESLLLGDRLFHIDRTALIGKGGAARVTWRQYDEPFGGNVEGSAGFGAGWSQVATLARQIPQQTALEILGVKQPPEPEPKAKLPIDANLRTSDVGNALEAWSPAIQALVTYFANAEAIELDHEDPIPGNVRAQTVYRTSEPPGLVVELHHRFMTNDSASQQTRFCTLSPEGVWTNDTGWLKGYLEYTSYATPEAKVGGWRRNRR